MKVIGSGFGRTGTSSVKKALEILGFGPCYHMVELQKRRDHIRYWHKLAKGKDVDLRKIFDEYNSSLDFFACIYYKELAELYPDAKVLHTVRDPERWYESTLETIYPAKDMLPKITKLLLPPVRKLMEAIETLIWKNVFHGKFEDREYAIKVFNDWTEEVKSTIPEDRLLIFNVKDGWEPLCKFLGVEVPDIPFPHENDRDTMKKVFAWTKFAAYILPTTIVGVVAGIGYAIFRFLS